MITFKEIADRGLRVILLGLGVSNSKTAAHLCALGLGARTIVRDGKPKASLTGDVAYLEGSGVSFVCDCDPTVGICDREDMSDTVIFRSPGIRPDRGELPLAQDRGAILTSEIEYVIENSKARVFAVTGSDGKTTSSTLTHLLLSRAEKNGRVYLGGNIGTPLIADADGMSENDKCVLEISSFQLMTHTASPYAAAITNISENHLDWHRGMDEYTAAKYRVVGKDTSRLVLNGANDGSRGAAPGFDGELILFSAHRDSYHSLCGDIQNAKALFLRDGCIIFSDGESECEVLKVSDIKLPGIHNVENYMTAIALTWGYVPLEIIREVAGEFGGVHHRLELVRTIGNTRFYNSSIDSSPTRSMAALSVLAEYRPTVILGGRDKGTDFSALADALCASASVVVITGEAIPKISAAISSAMERAPHSKLKVCIEEDFETAVRLAASLTEDGGVLVLSPACTSFDHFKNFEERGRFFCEIVNSL